MLFDCQLSSVDLKGVTNSDLLSIAAAVAVTSGEACKRLAGNSEEIPGDLLDDHREL